MIAVSVKALKCYVLSGLEMHALLCLLCVQGLCYNNH